MKWFREFRGEGFWGGNPSLAVPNVVNVVTNEMQLAYPFAFIYLHRKLT